MDPTAPFDPFEALGLPRDASTATIKGKFRELARRYHPNRQQGPDESKTTLSEQFYTVHQAFKHVIDPEKRRRYLELLRLAEQQQELLARMADLLTRDENDNDHAKDTALVDGYISSDADEDLPQIGLVRRQTVLKRTSTIKQRLGDGSAVVSPPRRNKSRLQAAIVSATNGKKDESDYFATRRKKLEKLRRKELAAFEQYKNAMVDKFQAELEVERTHDLYDQAKWKREYFERAPRETTERLRSFQHFMSAYRAFGQQAPRRRNRSTVSFSGQILSTEDLYDSGFLMPDSVTSPSKTNSMHKRGWSSDITGDQTSSDEHSSGPATPRPSMSFTWNRRHSRNTSLDAFQLPSVQGSNVTSQPHPVQDLAPFKMIVKQPTGFHQVQLANDDSSPESAPHTPRSCSPNGTSSDSNQYTLVPTRRLAELFRPGRDRTRSPSGDRRATPRTASAPNSGSTTLSEASFSVRHVDQPRYSHVAMENVHILNYAEKSGMLGTHPDVVVNPAELLARLCRLDCNVSTKFMVKPDIMEAFNFRLIYDHREVTKDQHQSFIALSYRRKHFVQKKHGYFTLPLDAEMFQAVWDERSSDKEGVWIDQICIDQESRTETTISMSAMDMVYRSARLVVVALDDIELDAHESEIIEAHMDEHAHMLHVPSNKRFRGKQPPYLDTHEDLYNVLRKIFRSSWFKRAWCRHEMRLARDHVFLIPCNCPDTWSRKKIIRFTSSCLTHLLALAIEVPFEPDIELVKPALHAFFRDRSKLGPGEGQLHMHHGNFTTVVAEVFGMEAGGDPRIPAKQRAADAMKDKISIILNTMECGLALTHDMRDPKMPLRTSESYYMLLTLALAARDPGALCSVGPPMRLVQAEIESPLTPTASSTWLFEPTNVDAGLNNYRTLNRLPATASLDTGLHIGEHFLQLDLNILKAGKVHHGFDDLDMMKIARYFVEVSQARKYGRNRTRYLIGDAAANRHFGPMTEVYVQTLACVFQCGPDWVEEVCQQYGVARWKQDGQAAWQLMVALKNTGGRWPSAAWSSQAAGFLMDFVNFLVIRGMPQRQILHHEEWRPVWVETGARGKLITFVPPGNIQPAIPNALLDCDYAQLARLWLLEPRTPPFVNGGEVSESWTLLGKSVVFSDDSATEQLHDADIGDRREYQKVFGRESPEIQRLLRERSLFH